jgi:hypothetical protein
VALSSQFKNTDGDNNGIFKNTIAEDANSTTKEVEHIDSQKDQIDTQQIDNVVQQINSDS